jgi:hypothetical protein
MGIFDFLKKKNGYRATYNKLENYLKKNRLIDVSGKAILQKEMVDAFLPEVDKTESSVFYHFKETFKSIEERQRNYFKELIDSNFDRKSAKAFFLNYQKVVSSSFELPATNALFISYWHKIVEKAKIEASMMTHLIDKDLSEEFFVEFEKITKDNYKKLTDPQNN